MVQEVTAIILFLVVVLVAPEAQLLREYQGLRHYQLFLSQWGLAAQAVHDPTELPAQAVRVIRRLSGRM